MYFLRNLILFTAKILIGIGDGVLVVFAIPYKLGAYSVKVLRVGKKTLRKRKAQTVFKDSIFAKKPKFNLSRKIKKAIPLKKKKKFFFFFFFFFFLCFFVSPPASFRNFTSKSTPSKSTYLPRS